MADEARFRSDDIALSRLSSQDPLSDRGLDTGSPLSSCSLPEDDVPFLTEELVTENSANDELSPGLARRLYISHFLSTWNFRGFEFGAVLFLANIFPNTLLPLSIYALVRSLAAIAFAPLVGRYIDTGSRLQVVRNSIVYQRGAVVLSCGVFYIMLWQRPHLKTVNLYILLALGTILACVEKLCAIMNTVSVERDWVVVIAGENEAILRTLNSQMRRIDLFCKLCSPLLIASLESYDTKVAIVVMGSVNAVSTIAEYSFIERVYAAVPKLVRGCTPPVRNHGSGDDLEQESASVPHDVVRLSLWRDLNIYTSQGAFLPSVSLSILYLTVLSFSGQMVTYLLASGYTSTMIAVLRLISTGCEMSATWMAPSVMGLIGPIRSGLWFLNFQMVCLAIALSFFWMAGSPVWAASGLIVGTILSRVGLWGFELSAQVIIQEQVEPEFRGSFSTTESSIQNIFELCAYASTIVFSQPTSFKWPATISVAAVYIAGALYASFVRRRRGHLVHVSRCLEGRKHSTLESGRIYRRCRSDIG
ncbi:putative iron-regulated transporter [Fonsecaea pedrosoi]|nr:putative iron-regulated transporter [Fonsecaea pedrosoi]